MKISILALSALTALTLSSCNEPQPKEEIIKSSGDQHSAIDSIATVNKDTVAISDDYCPPCGRG